MRVFIKNRWWAIHSILAVLVLLVCSYGLYTYITAPSDTVRVSANNEAVIEPVQSISKSTVPQNSELKDRVETIKSVVNQGDTAGKIFQEWLNPTELHEAAEACSGVFSLRRLRAGRPYAITITNDVFTRFEYEVDSEQKLILDRSSGTFVALLEDIDYDKVVQRIEGTVQVSLFKAVTDAGETSSLAIRLAEIFAWEINFIRDLRAGDAFSLLVEKRFRDGEFKSYGPILAATFINQGARYDAFLFRDALGIPHYYTGEGQSLKRAFLKAPLSFTRISSTFTGSRLHPTLKVWRAHPGIDYAAPSGTPVKAVGNGVVTFKGWGTGAGNYIALRHLNGYETMYLHLSGFAKNLAKGQKVKQGDIIGYVGSTGYSTGPHLDFRMKKDGVYINPLTTISPRTEPVGKKDTNTYSRLVTTMREYLEGRKDPLREPPL